MAVYQKIGFKKVSECLHFESKIDDGYTFQNASIQLLIW